MHNLRAPLIKKMTDEWQEVFEKIKEILTSDLFLAYFDHNREIVIVIDASSYRVEAGILLKYKDWTMKAAAHASGSLLPAEQNILKSRRVL